MKLEILKSLNEERAQRRAVVLVTNTESGEQRLVKAADLGKDPFKPYLEKRIRMGKSGIEETPQGKLFSRKRSGACAYCQRRIQIAVKRARLLALLPFVGR